MCVSKREGQGSFLQLQVSEMSERNRFKIGAKLAVSLNMGKNLC